MTPNVFKAYMAVLLTVFVVGLLVIGFRATKQPQQHNENGRFFTTSDAHGNMLIIDSRTGNVNKHYKN